MEWAPAIYEHKAALIGRSPVEVSKSAELLATAILKEHEIYRADYLTVGLDVYNIEAEALGAAIRVPGKNECPDIDGRLYDLSHLPESMLVPDTARSGRFPLLLDAAAQVEAAIGDQIRIRVAASGPVTLAAKLAGLEGIIMSLFGGDGAAVRLLEFCTGVAEAWCGQIRQQGLEVILFDSMAAPPMFSPDMFAEYISPLFKRLMSLLAESGQEERELVIGGDTVPVAQLLRETGATILLCDFAADATDFAAGISNGSEIQVRRNVNPAALAGLAADDAAKRLEALADSFRRDLGCFAKPIAGTGILPYNFDPEDYAVFKTAVEGSINGDQSVGS